MLNGRKVILVCPAYVPAELFRETRRRMAELDLETPGVIDEKWLLLLKYPLPTVEGNEAMLKEYAAEYGYRTFDVPENLGEPKNVMAFLTANPQPRGTIYIKFDGDAWTTSKGWDKAIAEVLDGDPRVAVCSLGIPELGWVDEDTPGLKWTAGHRAFYHPSMMRYDIAGSDLDFILDTGGFRTPDTYWGGLEGCVYEEMLKHDRCIVYLNDYREALTDDLEPWKDPLYGEWKWENYHKRFTGDFVEYLRR